MRTVTRLTDGAWCVIDTTVRIWAKTKKRNADGQLERALLKNPIVTEREQIIKRRKTLKKMGIKPIREGTEFR